MSIDSSSTPPDIFDAPCAPLDEDDGHLADRGSRCRAASNSVSTMNE